MTEAQIREAVEALHAHGLNESQQGLIAAAIGLRDNVRLVPSLESGKLYVQNWLTKRAGLEALPEAEVWEVYRAGCPWVDAP